MNKKKYKLFFHDDNMYFDSINNDAEIDYKYIKKQINNGKKQVVLSSKVMMDILDDIYHKIVNEQLREFELKNIIFIDDDSELNSSIEEHIFKVKENIDNLLFLIEYINLLCSQESIEIRNISFNLRDNNNNLYMLDLYVNGILYVQTFDEKINNKNILKYLSDIIWSSMKGWFI